MSLNSIWENQIVLQEKLTGKKFPAQDPEFVRESALGIFTELGEALAIDKSWKTWKKVEESFSKSELTDEIADIWLFLINFSLANNLQYEKLIESIEKKQEYNFKRFIK